MLPRIVRSPVDICFGTSPSQAPKSRPFENGSPVPIAATIALEMSGPMPGMLISRAQPWSCRASASISLERPSMRSSSRRQSPERSSMIRNMRGESTSVRLARMSGNSARRKRSPWRTAIPALQQERADLIDDAGALTHQSLAHPMQGLQIKLVGRLGRDKFHRRALHCFSDRFRIAIVILVTFAIRPHVFRRHQPGVVAKRLKFATEMMRPGAGLHANQTRRQVGKPRFHLATRPLLAQHQGSTPILADDVERILADTMPITAILLLSFSDMAC